MLEASTVSFSYDGINKILDSISICIKQGEIVLLTGPTGSGKSTLAKVLSGFIPRTIRGDFSGNISIEGEPLTPFTISEIAQRVALVQQDPDGQICTLRVFDEVAFGPENFGFNIDDVTNGVGKALSAVEVPHLDERQTHTLSGGEKQRVAIASMLAFRPEYLILDEPTSSLDPRGTKQLVQVLSELKRQGIGVLIIEHNIGALTPIADRILTLSEGKISNYQSGDVDGITSSPVYDINPECPVLDVQNVSFSYNDKIIIKNVTLSVFSGEVVAIMGDNGSGKTTLLHLLNKSLTPNSGNIYLESINIRNLKTKDLALKTGKVFQNPNHQIFERTVWKEQILTSQILDIPEESTEKSEEILRRAELWEIRNRNPFSLSHGQKRRLNVSSVVIPEPILGLFDEPFIGQDGSGRTYMTEVILGIAERGGASIVITHDPKFVLDYCSRLIFIDDGSIMLDGAPGSVMTQLTKMGRQEYTQQGGDT